MTRGTGTPQPSLLWAVAAVVTVGLIALLTFDGRPSVSAQSQSNDATLSDLTLSGVDFGAFASGTTSYTADVAKSVTETTVTATVNHSGASYVVKLDGVKDADGEVSLSVGSNVITIEVTAEDGETTQTYTVTVTRAANTPATGTPTISGTAQVHRTLTAGTSDIADDDGMSGVTFNYQWFANDGSRAVGSGDRLLGSFTDPTYVVQSRDVDEKIWVQVWFTDEGGVSEFLDSEVTEAVTAAANPKAPTAPEMLGVDPLSGSLLLVLWRMDLYPYGDGGSKLTGYKIQWKAATDSWETEADVSEKQVPASHTTGAYALQDWILTELTEGVSYTVRVVATNDVGDSASSDESSETAVSKPPITVSGTVMRSYDENSTKPVGTYVASGSDKSIAWSLSGNDSDDFSISAKGVLSFSASPDYENPSDADADNVYKVTVNASDGANSASRDVTVYVSDVDEEEDSSSTVSVDRVGGL